MEFDELRAIYLFALLITGDAAAAEDLVVEMSSACVAQLAQIRHRKHSRIWMIRQLRQAWLNKDRPPTEKNDAPADDAAALAREISALAEPARSAMALFYTGLLKSDDAADALDLSLEQFSASLGQARDLLQTNHEPAQR
ncbi:MAG: hypothetical protein M3O82_08950 [Verrucomicrobiota bacterium]|nr:hypothetical protein [Verrucomicrobiota bacterium]